jgi:hypothetical protein
VTGARMERKQTAGRGLIGLLHRNRRALRDALVLIGLNRTAV